MSERGSFVTEYICCDKCFEAAKQILYQQTKELCGQVIDSWTDQNDGKMPIIAGKIGSPSSEVVFFEINILPKLQDVVCCDLRVAVISESGEFAGFIVEPNGAHNMRKNPMDGPGPRAIATRDRPSKLDP